MQNSRTTAGETAKRQTKWGWGLLALAGMVVAITIEGSILITAAGTAMTVIGAWLGGYMTEDASRETQQPAAAGERRAA